ncbi:MAG: hypothetical protein EAZ55_14410 [Cytophagales bacterium]|nr:MAG: hypothetical protein EAZ55_14410 [Cytophagales bacterium]
MRKRYSFALFILFISFFTSCLPNVAPMYYIAQEAKDYTIFQAGSYWVYQNVATLQKDTNSLLSTNLVMNTASVTLKYQYESHQSKMRSSFYQENMTYTTAANWGTEGRTITRFKFDNYNWDDRYVFLANTPVGTGLLESIVYANYYEKYEVAGKTYTEVREFYITDETEPIDQRTPRYVWFAKNVGIIKKRLFNGETWELIQHEVKQ